MPRLWPMERVEVELTVAQGMFGRPDQPSDSDEDNKEPEPDLPSNAVSPICWSSSSQHWVKDEMRGKNYHRRNRLPS